MIYYYIYLILVVNTINRISFTIMCFDLINNIIVNYRSPLIRVALFYKIIKTIRFIIKFSFLNIEFYNDNFLA